MSTAGADPEIIARLESEASRNPRGYRLRLALIAVGGDFALTVTQLAPWAAPIVIGALWVNVKTFYFLGAAAVVFLAWMLRPAWRFEGRELKPDEAPQLHAELDRLKQKLQVPGRMRVFLDDSFNASAAETRGWFGVLGTQCALTLGVPLLVALDREQVLAVIAHELGHFSRRHGRLGQWLYRARVGWNQYAQSVGESDSVFDQAASWYARQFVPFFSARSFVHSRQCEYEADADAALAVGSRTFAAALSRTAIIARLWTERLPRQIMAWQFDSPQVPEDFYERFARAASECPVADAQAWLDDALHEPSGWLDTHPSLSERLEALKQEPSLVGGSGGGGRALLGDRWPGLLGEFNRKWAAEAQPDWLIEHLRMKHIAQPLLAAGKDAARGWSDDLRLARARALRGSDPEAGMAELRELHQTRPGESRITFAYAAALLREGDEAGVGLLETLARRDPAFRAQAFQRVLAFYERKGDSRQMERWSAWLKRAAQALGDAVAACLAEVESERLQPDSSSMPAPEKTAISESIRLDPCVGKAWLFEATAQLRFSEDKAPIPVVVHVLGLAIDPEAAKRLEQDEETIAERYERLLQMLLPPGQTPVVRSYFTTEAIPSIYRAAHAL